MAEDRLLTFRAHHAGINRDLLVESMGIFLKYDGALSLADAASIAVMDNMKISEIVSFDSDFDKVDFINRIHTL